MAKAQTNYATNAANNLINQAQGLTAPLMGQFQSSLGAATDRQGKTFDASFGALQDQMQSGGYDPAVLDYLRSSTKDFATTGGYDPESLKQMMGGYSDLATTGGFSPEQGQAFIRQATEGTEATYGALQDQARRAQVATGGQGTSGAISQMARQLSQTQGRNTLDAEVALNERQTANKLIGLGGESNLAGNVAAGKRAGGSMQLGLEGNVAGNKMDATRIMSHLFDTTTGQISDLGNKLLQTLGLNFRTQAEAIQALTQLSKNPGKFQTIFGDLIAGAGAAGGILGGLGGLSGGGDAGIGVMDLTPAGM
jgi:hypothetical protein